MIGGKDGRGDDEERWVLDVWEEVGFEGVYD